MKKIISILILVIVILLLSNIDCLSITKRYVGLFIDKIGITHNSFDISIEDRLKSDTYIYWMGDNGTKEPDILLLYHRGLFQNIPTDYYGKTKLVIKMNSDSILYDKIGLLKLESFSKHNYKIELKQRDSLLIINWSIDNWYSEELSVTDTLLYEKK